MEVNILNVLYWISLVVNLYGMYVIGSKGPKYYLGFLIASLCVLTQIVVQIIRGDLALAGFLLVILVMEVRAYIAHRSV